MTQSRRPAIAVMISDEAGYPDGEIWSSESSGSSSVTALGKGTGWVMHCFGPGWRNNSP